MEWVKKTFYLLDRKMRRKNQISKYHVPSSKRYNKEDMRLIIEKPSSKNIKVKNQKIHEVCFVKNLKIY